MVCFTCVYVCKYGRNTCDRHRLPFTRLGQMSEWSSQARATLYFYTDSLSWLDVVDVDFVSVDGSTIITLRSCSSGLLPVSFPLAPIINVVRNGATRTWYHKVYQGALQRSAITKAHDTSFLSLSCCNGFQIQIVNCF